MSYVAKVTGPEEKLISISRLHWIYPFEGMIWFLVMLVLGFVADYYLWVYAGSRGIGFELDFWVFHFDEMHTIIPWAFGAVGLAVFWPLFLKYVSTEVGLTDKRIIHKTGLVMIEVQQVDLEDIRAENVRHGWFGWLLGYGRLHLDCRFVDDLYLPAIKKPYKFVKAAHIARMKHPDIAYEEDDLSLDIARVESRREKAYRLHKKIKDIRKIIMLSFNKSA